MFESSPGQGLPLFCLSNRTGQVVSSSITPLSTAPFSSRTAEKQFCVLLWKGDKAVLASKNREEIQEAEPDACRFKSIPSTAKQQMQRGNAGSFLFSSCPQNFGCLWVGGGIDWLVQWPWRKRCEGVSTKPEETSHTDFGEENWVGMPCPVQWEKMWEDALTE